jgi:hypothetical protein
VQQQLHTLLTLPKLCIQERLRLFARATMDHFKLATHYSQLFKTRGIMAASGAPLLWRLVYLTVKHTKPSKSGKV